MPGRCTIEGVALDSSVAKEHLSFPERLGRYNLLLPIASGGMATVYLARSVGHAGFERDVALKLTHGHLRDQPDFINALIDEARLAGRIRHPNVVSVLDVGRPPSDDPSVVWQDTKDG